MSGAWLEVLAEDADMRIFANATLKKLGLDPHEFVIEKIQTQDVTGNKKQWITKRFPEFARRVVAQSARRRTALLVITDADECEVASRKKELLTALDNALDRRGHRVSRSSVEELVLYWIPKWHIETWALFLSDREGINEQDRYKSEADLRNISFGNAGKQFARYFQGGQSAPASLPAFDQALRETKRLLDLRRLPKKRR